jgi:hypothetical protein
MVSLCFESALHIAAQLRRRELSAVECLEYFRARVERLNPALNAIVVLDWDRAYEAARRADQELAKGHPVGPLHGVPMTIKESYDVAGLPTTWGDRTLSYIAGRDDSVVQRLKAAGAVFFGKTNVPYRLLDFQSYNDIYGVTNNPWDHTRTPGGSSGGAAAALAAGLTVARGRQRLSAARFATPRTTAACSDTSRPFDIRSRARRSHYRQRRRVSTWRSRDRSRAALKISMQRCVCSSGPSPARSRVRVALPESRRTAARVPRRVLANRCGVAVQRRDR